MRRNAKMAESLRLLRSLEVPIETILDVGVQHLTPPLVEVFPDKKHLLFEPIADYFPHIIKNYSSTDYDLVNAAVCDVDGTVTIHSERKNLGNEISHSYIVQDVTATSRIVDSIRLDTFLSGGSRSAPYLLKIDVEGADVPAAILRGCQNTLAQTSVVVIEMTVDRFTQRTNLLDQAGFDIWDVVDLCYYGDCLWQFDALFISRRFKQAIPLLRPMHQKPFRRELWQVG
jgi:FkbM family methyltransferase